MMAAMILPARFRQSRDSVDVQTARFWADWDGTVMEQRGRNPWQNVHLAGRRKVACTQIIRLTP